MCPLPAGKCWFLMEQVIGSCQFVVSFEAWWNHNGVLYTDGDSTTVWLGRGAGTGVVHVSFIL